MSKSRPMRSTSRRKAWSQLARQQWRDILRHFLTLTNLGSGSRGGTRGCVGELTTMGSWEVAGKQVVLKDRNGNPIGRVFKSADNRFDGQTNSGQPLSLSR